MSFDQLNHIDLISLPHWVDFASQGISEATDAVVKVCPGFGQPGWAPFCFLNGNPLFNAFDLYQDFIQSSVVSLHDLIKVCLPRS